MKLKNFFLGTMIVAMACLSVKPAYAQSSSKIDSAAANSRVFLLTATYGVVAGTLTGIGSLAFYDTPSRHTRNIAMGASIGLYVGILLGAYMVYVLPGADDKATRGSPSKGGGSSGPVLEDPLRLDSMAPVTPTWAPYVAYQEKQKTMLFGFHTQF